MPEALPFIPTLETIIRRWPRGYVRKTPRSIVPGASAPPKTAIDAGFQAAVPWKKKDFPGQGRAWREILAHDVPDTTLRRWRNGERVTPPWAAAKLLAFLRSRKLAIGAAIEALEAEQRVNAGKRRGVGGLQRIDPVTGLDGRGRTGRRGKVKEV